MFVLNINTIICHHSNLPSFIIFLFYFETNKCLKESDEFKETEKAGCTTTTISKRCIQRKQKPTQNFINSI